jgi:hypothetical protein
VFERYKPDAVIAFGKIAREAMRIPISDGAVKSTQVVYSPHPAVRDPKQTALLTDACRLFKEMAALPI